MFECINFRDFIHAQLGILEARCAQSWVFFNRLATVQFEKQIKIIVIFVLFMVEIMGFHTTTCKFREKVKSEMV